MDIHFYFHRWLLSMAVALLMHQCQDVTVMGEAGRLCPQGFIFHRFERFNQEHVTCCKPVRCDVGKEVKECMINGTQDKCEACGPFTNQSHRTSSYTMDKKCVHWPLDEKCKSGGRVDDGDVRTQRCLCDVEKGFKFSKPELTFGAPNEAYCQASNMPCEPGFEPTIDGNCKPCDKDHFKDKVNYELCQPKTNCTLMGLKFIFQSDATADNRCSKAEITTTPEAVKPTIVVQETKKPEIVNTTPKPVSIPDSTVGTPQNAKDQDSDDAIAVWPIICVVITVLIVIVLIGFILLLRRRRIPICGCLGLKGSDPEKYATTQCPSSLPAGDHHYKNVPTGGHYIDSHLSPGEKVMNNNVNGGLIHTIESQHMTTIQRPHLQHNGGNFVQFSGTDSSDSESQMHFQNQQNSFQATVVPPSSRPGILRNGNKPHHGHGQIVYAQARATRPQDASMDSIGREKLHVNIDRYQANQDLGENDPLLIADDVTGSGTLPGQGVVFQNRGNLGPHHSPPVPQAASSQVVYLPHSSNLHPHCQNVAGYMHPISNINPNYSGSTSSGNSSPAIQAGQQTHQVTFAPTLDTVTFKRSISVIANPEGEAEEELEANVPRFSQLLPDGDDPSLASNPILRMAQERETMPMDSPQRDTTHQTRTPSERLQMRPPQNPLTPTFISPAPPEPMARHQQLNQRPPYFPRRSSGCTENMPDHCIMDLKEHQLANSLSSSSANGSSGETMLKHTADTDFNLDNFTASADQTDMKTLGGTIKEEDTSPGAGANSKVHPLGSTGIGPEASRIRKSSVGGVMAQNISDGHHANNSTENKMFPLGNNSVDRKRTPSGGSTGVSNLAERKRVPSGDKQKSCLKNFGQEDGQCVNKRPQRLGRGVSFEEDEARREDSLGQDTEPKQIRDSLNSSDGLNLDSDDGKEAKKWDGQNSGFSSGDEENSKFMRTHGADTDLSSSDSTPSSPSRANVYRRSQSESTAGSSESGHKPPPRSLSEEKSQKTDKPIAKVKPMPASDSSVNQLPPGGVEEATTTSSLTNEESGDESSLEFSAPELHSSNPGDEADEDEDETEHGGAGEEEGRL